MHRGWAARSGGAGEGEGWGTVIGMLNEENFLKKISFVIKQKIEENYF